MDRGPWRDPLQQAALLRGLPALRAGLCATPRHTPPCHTPPYPAVRKLKRGMDFRAADMLSASLRYVVVVRGGAARQIKSNPSPASLLPSLPPSLPCLPRPSSSQLLGTKSCSRVPRGRFGRPNMVLRPACVCASLYAVRAFKPPFVPLPWAGLRCMQASLRQLHASSLRAVLGSPLGYFSATGPSQPPMEPTAH